MVINNSLGRGKWLKLLHVVYSVFTDITPNFKAMLRYSSCIVYVKVRSDTVCQLTQQLKVQQRQTSLFQLKQSSALLFINGVPS